MVWFRSSFERGEGQGGAAAPSDALMSVIDETVEAETELDIVLFRKGTALYLQGQFDQAVLLFRSAGGKLGRFFVERCKQCKALSAWPGYFTLRS